MKKITTATKLAKAMNRSTGVVSRWRRRPDWPVRRRAPWSLEDVEKIKAWATETLSRNPDEEIESLTASPFKQAQIRLLIERTAKVKLERELLAGGYVKKEDVDKEQVQKIHSLRAKMRELPLRSALIAHKSEAECEVIITEWMREICSYYAGGGA